eukprot:2813366-Rhodomonas_salina.1
MLQTLSPPSTSGLAPGTRSSLRIGCYAQATPSPAVTLACYGSACGTEVGVGCGTGIRVSWHGVGGYWAWK